MPPVPSRSGAGGEDGPGPMWASSPGPSPGSWCSTSIRATAGTSRSPPLKPTTALYQALSNRSPGVAASISTSAIPGPSSPAGRSLRGSTSRATAVSSSAPPASTFRAASMRGRQGARRARSPWLTRPNGSWPWTGVLVGTRRGRMTKQARCQCARGPSGPSSQRYGHRWGSSCSPGTATTCAPFTPTITLPCTSTPRGAASTASAAHAAGGAVGYVDWLAHHARRRHNKTWPPAVFPPLGRRPP